MGKDELHEVSVAPIPPPLLPMEKHFSTADDTSACHLFTSAVFSLIKLTITVVLLLLIVITVLFFAFHPKELQAYVEDAALSQFDLDGNLLRYNLTLAIAVRNPNNKLGVYYDSVEARALYDGSRFGFAVLPIFFQEEESTAIIKPDFNGFGSLTGDSVAATYESEKERGFYTIEVVFHARIRVKAGALKMRVKKQVDCRVKLPVAAGGGESPAAAVAPVFLQRTECDVSYTWFLF
ncbi:hypothetical protein HPP92_006815 [Vanilla planifolia]|uniref:Late embryogenesis abundant protein LEA-2 subgroup domain-containing protein n=1 Tax=Vanilla planifolia TaxID=51239 RepID=A0A835V5A8_VANPL|nr:hypothetical protein HPP92_006815 [Vanilla planifolia]